GNIVVAAWRWARWGNAVTAGHAIGNGGRNRRPALGGGFVFECCGAALLDTVPGDSQILVDGPVSSAGSDAGSHPRVAQDVRALADRVGNIANGPTETKIQTKARVGRCHR